MANLLLHQYKLLLWKNFQLRRRQPLLFTLEILAPVVIIGLLATIRSADTRHSNGICQFQSQPLPSMGTGVWMQTFMCNVNNTCHQNQPPQNIQNPTLSNLTSNLWDVINLATDPNTEQAFNKLISDLTVITDMNNMNFYNLGNNPQFQTALQDFLKPNYYLDTLLDKTMTLSDDMLAASQLLSLSNSNGINNAAQNQFLSYAGKLCGNNSDLYKILSSNFLKNIGDNSFLSRSNYSTKHRKHVSKECYNFYTKINSGQRKYIFQMLEHLLLGRIYFAPDTPITRAVLKKANITFEGLGNFQSASTAWNLETSQWLRMKFSSSPEVDAFRQMFALCQTASGFTFEKQAFCRRVSNWLDTGNINSAALNWVRTMDLLDIFFNFTATYMPCFELDKFVGFNSETEMNSSIFKEPHLWAAVVFDGLSNVSVQNISHVKIRIRMENSKVYSTLKFKVLDRTWSPGPRREPILDRNYYTYGFIQLQEMIGNGIIETLTSKEIKYAINLQQFPFPCYTLDGFTSAIGSTIPLFMMLGWIFTVAMTVRTIVYEKETRLKEVMKIMGLSNGILWLAWFTTSLIVTVLSVIVITIILKISTTLLYASSTLLFFVIFSFIVSLISQCFFISVFFNQANIAATIAGLLYIICFLPYSVMQVAEDAITEGVFFSLCLLPQVAFSVASQYIARYEEKTIGIQWNNVWTSPSIGDTFSMGNCIVMCWVDAVIYSLATWYIEAVFPGQFGIPRVWYFPFTKDYWFRTKNKINQLSDATAQNECESELFEADPQGLIIGVQTRELHKVYKNSKLPAVDGLNLKFFEGQITSLLGHNGAGKTTTLSIISGLLAPTSGTVYIYGRDILHEMDTIHGDLGICPQFNVLFDNLTVEEHIYFYALLKGMKSTDVKAEITNFINAVDLSHKRHELSKHLSGGMKRKLSVAMAFVGGSRLVILDEPTAGMDPYARRAIWELLGSYRQGRTVILTTHHMDEADILGDRIAIINKGKLRCVGSSDFLRKSLGTAYNLIIVKEDSNVSQSNISSDDIGITDRLKKFITTYVPDAKLEDETLTEYFFKLPSSGLIDGSFSSLLRNFKTEKDKLGIKSYGLADTSLEEIFLDLTDDPDNDFNKKSASENTFENVTDVGNLPKPITQNSLRSKQINRSQKLNCFIPSASDSNVSLVSYKNGNTVIADPVNSNGTGTRILTGFSAMWSRMLAIWIMRFHQARRNKKIFASEMIFPPFFIFITAGLTSLVPPLQRNPPMELHPWLMAPRYHPNNLHTFFANLNTSSDFTTNFASFAGTSLGSSGTRCMNSTLYSIPEYPCSSIRSNWSLLPSVNTWTNSSHCLCSNYCPNPFLTIPQPSQRLMPSTDYMHNLTDFNVTDYLLRSYDNFIMKRYGGFTFRLSREEGKVNKDTVRTFRNSISENSTFSKDLLFFMETLITPSETIDIWFNNKGYISNVAYLGILQNALLRYQLPLDRRPNVGISFFNHPLNRTVNDMKTQLKLSMSMAVLLATCVIFAVSFIPASFVIVLVDERITNSKHLQMLSGLNPYLYWIANYMWDIFNYAIPCTLCIIIFLIFQVQAYISPDTAYTFVSLMILYGFAIIPAMYPATFYFNTTSSAFVVVSFVNIVICLVTTLSVYILGMLEEDNSEIANINFYLKHIFLVFPQFCIGIGLINLSSMDVYREYLGVRIINPHHFDTLGLNIVALCIQAVILFGIVLLIERRLGCRCCPIGLCRVSSNNSTHQGHEADADVQAERERVLSGAADEDPVKFENLTKEYRSRRLGRPAVDNLCFGVRRGECFGLLGVNGAGKTTTFKMLTSYHSATSGSVLIEGQVVSTDGRANTSLGYCPQFDALNPFLTARETLSLYARLRGVAPAEVPQVVNWAIRKLRLETLANKICQSYSGGNKRKLSTAVALIGNPPVILLDEPTSGMDAGARRFLWNCINTVVQEGRSVILTSHSMEECEALCHRLTIMVNGRFRCLGSVQHLKNKFGEGYNLHIKLNNANPCREMIDQFMANKLPNCALKVANYTLLEYKLPSEMDLAVLLDILVELNPFVDRYSLSQTSLDQVFIDFAREQNNFELDEFVQLSKLSTSSGLNQNDKTSISDQSNSLTPVHIDNNKTQC